METYDFDPQPNQLEIDILLSGPGVEPHFPRRAVLDTGSDKGSVPEEFAQQLAQSSELSIVDTSEVRLHGQEEGEGSERPVIACMVKVGDIGPLQIRAIVHPGDVLLGMDWFNQVDTRYHRDQQRNVWSLSINPV